MKYRLWILLVTVCLCMPSLFACFTDGQQEKAPSLQVASGSDENSGNGSEPSADDPAQTKLLLADPEQAYARIVLPADATEELLSSADFLRKKISSLTGSSPTVERDNLHGDSDASAVEILMGVTARAETREVFSKIGYGDFAVKVVGNKIVVGGPSAEATDKAVYELNRKLEKGLSTGKKLEIKTDLSISGTVLNGANRIPKYPTEHAVSVTDCGDGCMALQIENTTAEVFEAYLSGLTSGGYTKREARNFISENNWYTQYVDQTNSITALYTAHNSEARILLEPLSGTALVSLQKETYTKRTDPLMVELGVCVDEDTHIDGMCYLYRLSDGSFIIFDGGYDDSTADNIANKRESGKRLHALLKQYAPDPDHIVVAAWFITHAHIDHIGTAVYFAKQNFEDVTIEKVICNLPSENQSVKTEMNLKVANYRSCIDTFRKNGSEVYKAHTGQIYYIRDAAVEILYTYEMTVPATITDFNGTSVVSRVTLGGNSVIMTGDGVTGWTIDTLCRMYGASLKADFFQIPHHGLNGIGAKAELFTQLYSYMTPKYVLWPNSQRGYNLSLKLGLHKYVFDHNLPIFLPRYGYYEFSFSGVFSGEAKFFETLELS